MERKGDSEDEIDTGDELTQNRKIGDLQQGISRTNEKI